MGVCRLSRSGLVNAPSSLQSASCAYVFFGFEGSSDVLVNTRVNLTPTPVNNNNSPLRARGVDLNVRNDLLRKRKDRCLNCAIQLEERTGYSADGCIAYHPIGNCEGPFTNAFGVLNTLFFEPEVLFGCLNV